MARRPPPSQYARLPARPLYGRDVPLSTDRHMDARRKITKFANRPLSPNRGGAGRGGALVIIGGQEDRTGEKKILAAVANRLGDDGKIVVCDVASSEPDALWEQYEPAFRALGVPHVY